MSIFTYLGRFMRDETTEQRRRRELAELRRAKEQHRLTPRGERRLRMLELEYDMGTQEKEGKGHAR